jgi:hypothetical protein
VPSEATTKLSVLYLIPPSYLPSRDILKSAIEDGMMSIGIVTKAENRYIALLRRKALPELENFYNLRPGDSGYANLIKGIDNPRNGTRNFAFASGNINGNKMGVLKAFSGTENVESFVNLREVRKLTTSIVVGKDRLQDSEVKILEEILNMTTRSDKGNIRIFTERVTCSSCGNAINEFLYTHRPGIKIELIGGNRRGGLNH